MIDFASASAVTLVEPGTFRVTIPDGWQQGRGAFGGLVMGILARAIESSEPDSRRALRTLSGDLCGPVLASEATVRVRTLRRGANQSNLQAELTQNDEVLACATAVLSAPRSVTTAPFSAPPPPPASFSDVPVLPMGAPPTPPFTRHYEYRNDGPIPFFAGSEARGSGFIRERAPLSRLDAPAIIGRLDAWWPTIASIDSTVRPMATIAFTAELLADPTSFPPDTPFRFRSQMQGMAGGFFVELRELWHESTLVALNQQTFAVIK